MKASDHYEHWLEGSGREPKNSNPHDYFPTPLKCTQALIEQWGWFIRESECDVLDPAAGNGELLAPLKGVVKDPGLLWGVEIDSNRAKKCEEKGLRVYNQDFLKSSEFGPADHTIIICNPPYRDNRNLAYAQKCLEGRKSPLVAMYLELDFMGAAIRYPLWQEHGLDQQIVFSQRQSHTEDGKVGSRYTSWFVWLGNSTEDKEYLVDIASERLRDNRSLWIGPPAEAR